MFAAIVAFFNFLLMLIMAMINIAFALGIHRLTAIRRRKLGKGTLIVGPEIWVLATLFGGVFVAGLYWLIHLSSLSPHPEHRPADS